MVDHHFCESVFHQYHFGPVRWLIKIEILKLEATYWLVFSKGSSRKDTVVCVGQHFKETYPS